MSRAVLSKTKLIIASATIVAAAAVGWVYIVHSPSAGVHAVTNSQHQLTQISYRGQAGVDALTLLKRDAAVQVKHYSYGDMVTAINGVTGSGPKYWTFYINGKMADVGAGAYKTKAADTLMWRLQ